MTRAIRTRCLWPGQDPLYLEYHDREWGVPVHDSRDLWEYLNLEAFQAGLSWITVLRKRENFRAAFSGFDPQKVARYTERDVTRLLGDAGIIRSRAKILATIGNARAYLDMREAGIDFAQWTWAFAEGAPIHNPRARQTDVPAVTPVAEALSKALKAQGYKFVGPTIVYAWMQAVGIVNDHIATCFRHEQIRRLTQGGRRRPAARKPATPTARTRRAGPARR